MADLRVGTRASALAMAQCDAVADVLRNQGYTVECVPIETRGDQVLDRSLHQIGGKGLFTEELERALLSDRIDLAVHSLKDLPTELPPGLRVGAYTLAQDRRDVLISKFGTLAELKRGAVLGTSSLRRAAFVRAIRPDLSVVPIRGNLATRLQKWRDGQVDALILAAAGILRMGWNDLISDYLDPELIVPSPGQGILAVEVAQHRGDLAPMLETINDRRTEWVARAERAVLHELGGGCQVPVGAYAQWIDTARLKVLAQAASVDGRQVLRRSQECVAEDGLLTGATLGEYLKDQGALALIEVQEG